MKKPLSKLSLADFDVLHAKTVEDYRVRTPLGGALSAVTIVLTVYLALASVANYWGRGGGVNYKESIQIDTRTHERLPIHLNISFPRLTCFDVELVAQTLSGETQLDFVSTLRKVRLTNKGRELDSFATSANRNRSELLANAARVAQTIECGSCYGAEQHPKDCCTTCRDVKARYSMKNWDVVKISREAVQCLRELDHPEVAVRDDEGCRLEGSLTVPKVGLCRHPSARTCMLTETIIQVGGNIHVALGSTRMFGNQLVHQFIPDRVGAFDTSHAIHHLQFGDYVELEATHPLDASTRSVDRTLGATASMQYFLHLVPTVGGDNRKKTSTSQSVKNGVVYRFVASHQYVPVLPPPDAKDLATTTTTTDAKKTKANQHLPRQMISVLPGVYFIYEISPFIVTRELIEPTFMDLVVDLLCVAGGVVSTFRLLDAGLHQLLHPA